MDAASRATVNTMKITSHMTSLLECRDGANDDDGLPWACHSALMAKSAGARIQANINTLRSAEAGEPMISNHP